MDSNDNFSQIVLTQDERSLSPSMTVLSFDSMEDRNAFIAARDYAYNTVGQRQFDDMVNDVVRKLFMRLQEAITKGRNDGTLIDIESSLLTPRQLKNIAVLQLVNAEEVCKDTELDPSKFFTKTKFAERFPPREEDEHGENWNPAYYFCARMEAICENAYKAFMGRNGPVSKKGNGNLLALEECRRGKVQLADTPKSEKNVVVTSTNPESSRGKRTIEDVVDYSLGGSGTTSKRKRRGREVEPSLDGELNQESLESLDGGPPPPPPPHPVSDSHRSSGGPAGALLSPTAFCYETPKPNRHDSTHSEICFPTPIGVTPNFLPTGEPEVSPQLSTCSGSQEGAILRLSGTPDDSSGDHYPQKNTTAKDIIVSTQDSASCQSRVGCNEGDFEEEGEDEDVEDGDEREKGDHDIGGDYDADGPTQGTECTEWIASTDSISPTPVTQGNPPIALKQWVIVEDGDKPTVIRGRDSLVPSRTIESGSVVSIVAQSNGLLATDCNREQYTLLFDWRSTDYALPLRFQQNGLSENSASNSEDIEDGRRDCKAISANNPETERSSPSVTSSSSSVSEASPPIGAPSVTGTVAPVPSKSTNSSSSDGTFPVDTDKSSSALSKAQPPTVALHNASATTASKVMAKPPQSESATSSSSSTEKKDVVEDKSSSSPKSPLPIGALNASDTTSSGHVNTPKVFISASKSCSNSASTILPLASREKMLIRKQEVMMECISTFKNRARRLIDDEVSLWEKKGLSPRDDPDLHLEFSNVVTNLTLYTDDVGTDTMIVPKLIRGVDNNIYQRVNEKPDGNCLFRAIARCMYGNSEDYPKVRAELCNALQRYVNDNHHLFHENVFIADNKLASAANPNHEVIVLPTGSIPSSLQYILTMRVDKTQGDNLEILAAQMRYNMQIVVIDDETKRRVDGVTLEDQPSEKVLYVLKRSGHYDTLLLSPIKGLVTVEVDSGPRLSSSSVTKTALDDAKRFTGDLKDNPIYNYHIDTIVGVYNRAEIKVKDVRTLIPGLGEKSFLNDEIMNLIGHMSVTTASTLERPVHYLHTYHLTKLMEGGVYDFSKVQKWCTDFLVDTKSMWLTPVNVGSFHWVLVIIDFASKSIRYYDPLPAANNQSRGLKLMHITKRFLKDLANLQGKVFVESQWSMEEVHSAPRQSNGYDCGVFVLEVMKRFAEGLSCTENINCIERRREYLNLILGL